MLRNCCPTTVEGVLHLPRPRRDPSPDDLCGLHMCYLHVQDELLPAQRKMLLLLHEHYKEKRDVNDINTRGEDGEGDYGDGDKVYASD